jgi:thiosulfate/3-mercaptopyruvate sulfurtransferase
MGEEPSLPARPGSAFGPLVSGAWLVDNLTAPDLQVIDCRWRYDHDGGTATSGRGAYEAGHVPGAVFVDIDKDTTGTQPGVGRRPPPEPAAFQHAMRRAGVSSGSRVVLYDDRSGFSAAWLWWLLRYHGHDSVALLDGGLPAWRGPLERGVAPRLEGDVRASQPRSDMRIDYEQMRQLPPAVVLLDARRPSLFRGEFEPKYPKAGHIPGARNAYWKGNLLPDGTFASPPVLRRRYLELGVREGAAVVAYCGSGISATHDLVALELAGLPGARLYPGSWSDWSARQDAPIEIGDG